MAYIDVDKARKHLRVDCLAKYPTTYIDGLLVAAEELTRIPTADVVEVVRCKDCKHFIVGYCCRDIKGRSQMHYMGEEAFFSYGERS